MKTIDQTELLWMSFGAIFLALIVRRRTVVHKESSSSHYLYLGALLLSFALIYSKRLAVPGLNFSLFSPFNELGLVMNALGLGFALWARFYLGNLWTGQVSILEKHQLIRTGPYCVTRHPIYTGMLVAQFGAALTQGELRSALSVVVLFGALEFRIRHEEAILRTQFKSEYDDYLKVTPKLLPVFRPSTIMR